MPVNKDSSGRHWVQVDVEVPGTPEEVWQAIATGPGISSWFVPTDMEQREGGTVVSHFGPGNSMDSIATVTTWEPPHRFVADSDGMGPGAPTVATEWSVEARGGGACTVRVVHSWFASTDDWDGQYEQAENGWPAFFRILRLYLAHFSGQPCSAFQLMGVAPEPAEDAWAALTAGLGLPELTVGQYASTSGTAPVLGGIVEGIGTPDHPEILLRLDAPGPGIAHLIPLRIGGMVYLPIRLFLYGDRATSVAAEAEPVWQAWLAEQFPPVQAPEAAMPIPEATLADRS
jgi:uncharacterized protein YndB with AHSA1/START domain